MDMKTADKRSTLKSFFTALKEKMFTQLTPGGYLKGTLLVSGILFVLCGLTVGVIDPYMYFHKTWLKAQYYDNAYAMIPGVLRQHEYDSVLFGSSICQNMKISSINEALSCRAVKAAAPGISPDAFDKFFSIAVRNRKKDLRMVLIGLDIFTYTKDGGPWKEYAYLYDRKWIPMEYLFSTDSLQASWEALRKNIRYTLNKKKRDPKMDLDTMFFYRERPGQYTGQALLDNVRSRLNDPPAVTAQSKAYLEKYLFSNIRNHPRIRFEIFLPPYHTYFWCTLLHQQKLEDYLLIRDYIIGELSSFPNVRLHDFQAESSIIGTHANYKDITHYKQELNLLLLEKIRKGTHRLTADSAQANTKKIRRMTEQAMKDFLQILHSSQKNDGSSAKKIR